MAAQVPPCLWNAMRALRALLILLLIGSLKGETTWYVSTSTIHGWGVFAARDLSEGSRIEQVVIRSPDKMPKLTDFGKLVNHAVQANTILRREMPGIWGLYTTRYVKQDEELLANYNERSNPWFIAKADPSWA